MSNHFICLKGKPHCLHLRKPYSNFFPVGTYSCAVLLFHSYYHALLLPHFQATRQYQKCYHIYRYCFHTYPNLHEHDLFEFLSWAFWSQLSQVCSYLTSSPLDIFMIKAPPKRSIVFGRRSVAPHPSCFRFTPLPPFLCRHEIFLIMTLGLFVFTTAARCGGWLELGMAGV